MIFINGRFLAQRPTGVNRFAFEMCKALKQLDFDFTIISSGDISEEYKSVNLNIIKYGKSSGYIWEQIELYCFLRKKKNPILISFTGLGPFFYKNHICTIHDLSFLRNPKWFSYRYYLLYKIFTPVVARNSKKIITVSNFSKKEILYFLKCSENKIIICNNALPEIFKQKVEKAQNIKYILSVSSIDPRKNFSRLIEAFLTIDAPEVKLFIIGKKASTFKNAPIIESKNVVWLGYVTDEELINLYRNALGFIYPSLYEGFGIPPLEALSQDCPIFLSDIEVHNEIYEDSAYYFDPLSVEAIKRAIFCLVANKEFLYEESGKKILNKFSWTKSAKMLISSIVE